MDTSTILKALKKAPFAYALHEMMFDSQGNAVDFKWIEVNKSFEKLFEHTFVPAQSLKASMDNELLSIDWLTLYGDMFSSKKPVITEKYVNSLEKWLMIYAYPLSENTFISFLFNISRRKMLDEREKQLKEALDMIDAYIYMKDCDSKYFYGNKATQTLFGVKNDYLQHMSDHDFFSKDTSKTLRDLDMKILNGEKTREEIETTDTAGNIKHYLEIKAPIYDNVSKSPSGIIGISTDITQKKAMEAKIKHLIDHDQLTNAYTRLKVFETLKEKLANNESITVAILDIDHFKTVNDTHGHIVGDEVLKKYVKRLETKLDDNDMVGRFGGEEFIIIFNDKDKYTAKKALEDVLESLKKHPLDIREKRIVLSFSGGICTPKEFEDTSNIKNVLAIADNRLYKAKQNGRNQIHID